MSWAFGSLLPHGPGLFWRALLDRESRPGPHPAKPEHSNIQALVMRHGLLFYAVFVHILEQEHIVNVDRLLDIRVVQGDLLGVRCFQDVLEDLSSKWIFRICGGFNKIAVFVLP